MMLSMPLFGPPGGPVDGPDVIGLFASWAHAQEIPGLFQIRALEQVFKFLFGHGVGVACGAEPGKIRMPVREEALTKRHHKPLEVDAGRTVKGALFAGEAIPEGFGFRFFRFQGELFHNAPGGPFVRIFPVEIQHGTDGGAFAALQAIVEMVFCNELFNFRFQVRHGSLPLSAFAEDHGLAHG